LFYGSDPLDLLEHIFFNSQAMNFSDRKLFSFVFLFFSYVLSSLKLFITNVALLGFLFPFFFALFPNLSIFPVAVSLSSRSFVLLGSLEHLVAKLSPPPAPLCQGL
jgi:hypothetical protein